MLRRFRIYLQGIPFNIVSDCRAVIQTLEKRDINARIARWSLKLQSFDFQVKHNQSSHMKHVDALSRSFGVLVVEDNPFEWNLMILQYKDPKIKDLMDSLEGNEDPHYELRNGVVYKKHSGQLLFVVPEGMEQHVLFRYHNEMGHIGVSKMIEVLKRTYWFPHIRRKCEEYIRNCLKCISFAPVSGKPEEGSLYPIPKGNIPFETIHIDHFGPMNKQVSYKKYILVVVDAFSKFVQLYATKTTNASEVIGNLTRFFQCYSTPKVVVSDRSSSFTSVEFEDFLKERDIKHVKIATGSSQANGQIERVNRVFTPMIAKLSDHTSGPQWYRILGEIEYSILITR